MRACKSLVKRQRKENDMRDDISMRRAALMVSLRALEIARTDGGAVALILDVMDDLGMDEDLDEAVRVRIEKIEDELRGKLNRLEAKFCSK